MSEILATNKELSKIIDNAVKRIGENHSLSRDSKGVEMNAMEIEKDRLKFRKDRISEGTALVKERGTTIDNALKEAADEIAEKMVLENTIGGMVKDVISEQDKKKLNILQKFDKFIQSTTMKNLAKKLASPDISLDDWKEAMEAYRHAEGRVEDLEDITPEDYTTYKEDGPDGSYTWDGEKYTSGSKAEGEWYGDPNTQGLTEQQVKVETPDLLKLLKCVRRVTNLDLRKEFEAYDNQSDEGIPAVVQQQDVCLGIIYEKLLETTFENYAGRPETEVDFRELQGTLEDCLGYQKVEYPGMELWMEELFDKWGEISTCMVWKKPPPGLRDMDEFIKQQQAEGVDESTRNTIKKLIKKKLKEGWTKKSMPGYEQYVKVDTDNSKINKEYEKEFKKKFDDYSDFEGNDKPEFPHSENSKSSEGYEKYENTTDDEEFIDDFAYPGLQDFDVHNQDMDRLSKYLEGSSETGNAQTDEKGEALGNVVPSDLGKKILKSKKRRKEKIDVQNASKTNLRGYTPDVQKVKQVKEDVKSDIMDMKKLWDYNKKTQ